MFEAHKIALWVQETKGWRRTFDEQADPVVNTKAGPGESNHNFGRAADLGFKSFRWLRGDGTVHKDDDWLNTLEKASRRRQRHCGTHAICLQRKLGLFRLGFERIHLQSYEQKTISSQASLVELLNSVGTMGWKTAYRLRWQALGQRGHSQADLELNGQVTKADIAKALTAATGKVVKEADIKAQQVLATKKALKADFEAAEKNWVKWVGCFSTELVDGSQARR